MTISCKAVKNHALYNRIMELAVFLATSLLGLIFLIVKLVETETSEDKYHQTVHKDISRLDDSPVVRFGFKRKSEYQKIKSNACNGCLFSNHYQKIEKFKPNFTLRDEEILSKQSKIVRLDFHDEENYFLFTFNHYYLGGDCFLHLKADALFQDYIAYPTSSYKAFVLLPRLLYDFNLFIKSPRFVPLPRLGQAIRYSESNVYQIEEYRNITKRIFVLYKTIRRLYRYLGLDRPMRIMIPVPFKRFNQINNNVGAVLLLFNGDETIEQFDDMFERKKYMALASNFLLISRIDTLFSSNLSVRENVDVVLTSIYSNTEDKMEYDMNWTTRVMPSEAVYVAVYSRIGTDSIKTNVTYTVATSSFKKTKTMEKYKME